MGEGLKTGNEAPSSRVAPTHRGENGTTNYVVQGVANIAQWRRNAWFSKPTQAKRVPNADLWFRLDRELRKEGYHRVEVRKVVGHAGPTHLAEGKAERIDVWGNGGADWIAQYASRHCNELPIMCRHAWCDKPRV